MTTLHDRARRLAGEVCENQGDCACVDAESVCARCRSIELAPAFASAMVSLARDFAREALMSIYEVDDNDQHSSDGERARGSFRVRAEFCGRPNVERRHYRKEFNDMIEAAIAAAEKGESK